MSCIDFILKEGFIITDQKVKIILVYVVEPNKIELLKVLFNIVVLFDNLIAIVIYKKIRAGQKDTNTKVF